MGAHAAVLDHLDDHLSKKRMIFESIFCFPEINNLMDAHAGLHSVK